MPQGTGLHGTVGPAAGVSRDDGQVWAPTHIQAGRDRLAGHQPCITGFASMTLVVLHAGRMDLVVLHFGSWGVCRVPIV